MYNDKKVGAHSALRYYRLFCALRELCAESFYEYLHFPTLYTYRDIVFE